MDLDDARLSATRDVGARVPLPPWLKTRLPSGPVYERVRGGLSRRGLHTVCEEARCPNIAECWGGGTATFMVLGEACTRACRFCSVSTLARPPAPDPEEPERLAEAVAELGLDYVVVTTVCRDDLPDQGAAHVADCLDAIRRRAPQALIEALVQDFRGERSLLARVLEARPDVLAHNLETVRRLTPRVRDPRAGYEQSLAVLRAAREIAPGVRTKSSLMAGLGETRGELLEAFGDLRAAGVDVLTLGQYLRPTRQPRHLPVAEFVPPAEFDRLAASARELGFLYVAAGPFVRSSYRAAELFLSAEPPAPGHGRMGSVGDERPRGVSDRRSETPREVRACH